MPKKILVTGASGYIGGRLVPHLLGLGYKVRCAARHPEHLEGRDWKGVDIVKDDMLDRGHLVRILKDVDAAYYLIHSMDDETRDFAVRDAELARLFVSAAKEAGLERIIYLGGLSRPGQELSHHLKSRHEVGEILRRGCPKTTEFRAAVIVGSGSISFEMIRYLVERLPLIPRFQWLTSRCQPIGIRDVLEYLAAALENEASAGRIVEIGGRDVVSYEAMLSIYARRRGLQRRFIPIPTIFPRLCAKFIGMISPIPSACAYPLVESLRNEVICSDDSARRLFPQIVPMDYDTAVGRALRHTEENQVPTRWTMELFPRHETGSKFRSAEGLLLDDTVVEIEAPAETVFAVYAGIGGQRGWFYMDWLWRLRGIIDRLIGGVGMRRGRRDQDIILPGEPLDFWRVEKAVPGKLLFLRAEMRVPGKGWLRFESLPQGEGRSLLRQTAYFEPKGMMGHLYWNLLYPVHHIIYSGLVREIKARAEKSRDARAPSKPPISPRDPSSTPPDGG